MTVQKQTTIQKEFSVAQVYKELKHDLKLCVMYLEMKRPEIVAEYFGTIKRSEIETKINAVIQEFPEKRVQDIQKIMLEIFTYFSKKDDKGRNQKTTSKSN